MALSKNKSREHKLRSRKTNVGGVNATEKIYVGGYLLREAASGVVTKAVAAGNVPLGVVVESMFPDDPDKALTAAYDNTSGADGVVASLDDGCVRTVRYTSDGEYAFAVASGTPKVGDPAYLVDDDNVTTVASVTGIIAGEFTRPAPGGGWFVDIEKRRVAGETFTPQATETDLAAITGGEAPTETEYNLVVTKVNAIIAKLEAAGIFV